MLAVQLEIQAPPELERFRARLSSIDTSRFEDIARLVGISETGPAIKVILATENSEWARGRSRWIAGFAIGRSGLIVIFPTRTPSYPHSSLEDVLRHEVAHVLIARAAAGGDVPIWFNEGLAMSAERAWRFEDQGRFLYHMILNPEMSLADVNRSFAGEREDQLRAYALAGAFVRQLIQRYGQSLPAEILSRVRRGMTFDVAFRDATAVTLVSAESDFWRSQRLWTRWVPIITSSAALWALITLLAMFAIRRRRQKDAEIRRAWEDEEDTTQEDKT